VGDRSAGGDAELAEGVGQVRFDRFLAEEQLGGDLAIGFARGDEFGDLELTGAERPDARLPAPVETLAETAQLALDFVAQADRSAEFELCRDRLQLGDGAVAFAGAEQGAAGERP
jgi:hypothetical protein